MFDWLQKHGQIDVNEMYRTFNCGVGMVVCVAAADAEAAQQLLTTEGETVYRIGQVAARAPHQDWVELA